MNYTFWLSWNQRVKHAQSNLVKLDRQMTGVEDAVRDYFGFGRL